MRQMFDLPFIASVVLILYCLSGFWTAKMVYAELVLIDRGVNWEKERWFKRPLYFLFKLLILLICFILWPIVQMWIQLW
jgi:hypothetical protein